MKIYIRILLLANLCLAPMSVNAETANELAIKIIKNQPRVGYNPRDGSDEELARAYAFNSRMTLNELMISKKGVTEELRICYAIHLIDAALGIQKVLRSGAEPLPKEKELMAKRLLLGARLAKLNNAPNKK